MLLDPTASVTGALLALQAAGPLPIEFDNSTAAWLDAARHDRADVLILGDSVVWFGGHGWDEGLNHAIAQRFGLAGTGLLHEFNSGSGFTLSTQFGWQTNIDSAPAAVQSHAVQGHVYTTGTGSQRRIGITIEPGSPLAGRPMQLTAWGGSSQGDDSVFGAVRRSEAPFTVYHQASALPLGQVMSELESVVFDLPAPSIMPPPSADFFIDGSDHASYVYLRALEPGAVGGTVTSIGLGGRSVRDFFELVWAGGAWNQQGRAAFLDNIVAGGSGKLMIPIFEGFNDRNETDPSLTLGITPGDSSAAFTDNVDTLIRQIRGDWALTGRLDSDLTFIVFGMYEILNAPNHELNTYRHALRQYALDQSGVTFIDLLPLSPPFLQARPAGLLDDGTHLSKAGSRFLGERIIDVLNWANCPGDIADDFGVPGPDGAVGFGDFLAMLGVVGQCAYGGISCLGDIADEHARLYPDGEVTFGDLLALLGLIGSCD